MSQRVNLTVNGHWGTVDGQPPPNIPICGLRNELCSPNDEGVKW